MRSYVLEAVDRQKSQYREQYVTCKRRPSWRVSDNIFDAYINFARTYLFHLGEILIDVSVEFKFANVANRDIFFWPDLRGIENVKFKVILHQRSVATNEIAR